METIDNEYIKYPKQEALDFTWRGSDHYVCKMRGKKVRCALSEVSMERSISTFGGNADTAVVIFFCTAMCDSLDRI